VLVRFVSQVNRAEIQFVPLGQDAKPMKDADWKYVQWGVEMAGAAAMAAPGFSVNAFPIGTIFSDVVKWTWAAFALTAATGLLMFTTNAVVYFHNPMFRFKMLALALAGLNMLVFELTAGRAMRRRKDREIPVAGKLAGIVSLVMWIAVIFFGRWIGFTTTGNETPDADIKIEGIFKN
jgi:hypothetical protein